VIATVLLSVALGGSMQVPAAPAAPAPSAPAPSADPASRIAPGDLWLVIYSVLPDRTAQFEAVARQVREALASSSQDVRKAQARDLRVHRSALPSADGKVMYFLQIPALTGDADRSGFDVLIDAVLPEQASALKKQLQTALDPTNPSGNTFLISVK
jgi:hypothetical protein